MKQYFKKDNERVRKVSNIICIECVNLVFGVWCCKNSNPYFKKESQIKKTY